MKITCFNLFLSVLLFLSACKKDSIIHSEDSFTDKVKNYTKTKLSETDYKRLDWGKLAIFDNNLKHKIVKIPLVGNVKSTDKALYLKVGNGKFEGNYFELKLSGRKSIVKTTSLNNEKVAIADISQDRYDDNLKIYTQGRLTYDSETASSASIRSYKATYTYNNQLYILISLLELGQGGSGNENNNNQEEVQTFMSDGGGGGITELVEIEYNDWELEPVANLVKIFNCFDLVAGGTNCTYEIKLNVDIPVNIHPDWPVNFLAEPGHVFLTVTKTNGSQSVTQNFGFYPTSGPQSLGLNDVNGKIVNDKEHEINASFKMDINEASFNLMKANAIFWATQQYNIKNNNCADFGLKLFNLARSTSAITLPPFPVTVIPLV